MPNFLSKWRVGHVLRPYYYGSHKWEDYLVDIQETIANLSLNQPANTHIQVALDLGLDDVNASIENINTGIESLRADFQWGFTLMIARQEEQIRLLNNIIHGLDVIKGVLELPLTTKARELIALGQRDHQIGLLPEALEKFLAAEQLNKVNFPLQLQIGKLFLYGKNKQDSVIDLVKATEHLLLAARYADTEAEWVKYRGEALFHAATAFYIMGGQQKNVGNPDIAQECLESALLHLRSAIDSWPVFTESYYLAAKCHALLGQRDEALANLEILSDRDRRYFAKMGKDKDFNPIRAEAKRVFHDAIANPGPNARAAEVKLLELRREVDDLARCWKCKKELELMPIAEAAARVMEASLSRLDVDIDNTLLEISSMQALVRKSSKDMLIDCSESARSDDDYYSILPEDQLPRTMNGSFLWRWDPARVKLLDLKFVWQLSNQIPSDDFLSVLWRLLNQEPSDNPLSSPPRTIDMIKNALSNTSVLDARILDHLLKHPHIIPEEWCDWLLEGIPGYSGSSRLILFLGTVYRGRNGELMVFGLRKSHRGLRWNKDPYVIREYPRYYPHKDRYCYHLGEDHCIATFVD
jgi:tetratricopeptide (TPR) repeat protein